MATTVSLTKINFMSEDTFNKLSSLDSQQLYAVEASSLITSVMNTVGKNKPSLQKLFVDSSGLNAGDITLDRPFTDFAYIYINWTNDSSSFRQPYIIPSWLLDTALAETDAPYMFGDCNTYWRIKAYVNGSTTSFFKHDSNNSRIRDIYGFNY